MRRPIILLAWWFVAYSTLHPGPALNVVGPFYLQSDCLSVRAELARTFQTTACWQGQVNR